VTDVKNITIHHEYVHEITLRNDFALVELKKALTLNTRTQIIKLPDSSYITPDGRDVLISGHGNTENPLESTELLRGVVVKISKIEDCKIAWSDTNIIIEPESMLCVSTDDMRSTCPVCIL
jgi:trypsin